MSVDSLDLRLLRVFVTIVESGGFAAAQSELNLSLSTISSHISSLESRLKLTLCRRGRSGFRLTPEGQAVYDEAKRMHGTLDQFDGRMRGLRERLNGTLAIGLMDNTISDPNSRIEKVIAAFTDAAPEARLTLVTRPPHEVLKDVISGQSHVAVASFPRVALGLEYLGLYTESQRFYCGLDHPLFARDVGGIDVNEVRKHDLVGRFYWGSRDLKIFAVAGPRAVVSDMEAEARLILSGRYLGYLPDHYARQFVEAGRMRPIRSDLFAYTAPFQAAFDAAQAKSGLLALFLRLLRNEYEKRTAASPPAAGRKPHRDRVALALADNGA